MERAIRVLVVSGAAALTSLAVAAVPAHAAPDTEIVPIIDAPGPSSGVAEAPATTPTTEATAPTTTVLEEQPLVTAVPLPVDPGPADDAVAPTTTVLEEQPLVTAVPLPVDPGPADDAVAPTTTVLEEQPLVTAVPLPVDPGPADSGDTDEVADDGAGFVINGPATIDVPTTLAPTDDPGVVIDGPATVDIPVVTSPRNEVGGTVYVDFNRNGADDGAEADPRAAGVGVFVIWDGDDAMAGTADDRLYEASTDANGAYRVSGLPDGGYTIAVNPAKMPPNSTVTVDPDGGLADATTVVTLAGGTVDHGQHFGLGTRPPDLADAVVIADTAEITVVTANLAGSVDSSRASDPVAQQLPATGGEELAVAVTIASVLLVVGVALFGVRRRPASA